MHFSKNGYYVSCFLQSGVILEGLFVLFVCFFLFPHSYAFIYGYSLYIFGMYFPWFPILMSGLVAAEL